MAAAAAPIVAIPLAEKAVQASVDLTKSVVAQIFDALRTPLLGYEQTISKVTKGGKSVRTVHKANIPAWAAVGAGLIALAWASTAKKEAGGGADWWKGPLQLFP